MTSCQTSGAPLCTESQDSERTVAEVAVRGTRLMMCLLLRIGEFFSRLPVVETLLCSDFGLDFFVVIGCQVPVLLEVRH